MPTLPCGVLAGFRGLLSPACGGVFPNGVCAVGGGLLSLLVRFAPPCNPPPLRFGPPVHVCRRGDLPPRPTRFGNSLAQ